MDFMIQKLFIIPEYPDYMIYPSGDIFSIRYKKFLIPRYDKNGYKRLTIKNKITNKIDTLKIHQLVAMCFLGYKKNSNFVVDHIDNNKLNNYLHNLQVITSIQNMRKEHMRKVQSNGLPYYIRNCKNGYMVKLQENKIKKNLGIFKTLQEALDTRNKYFKELLLNVKMK
tara:strand:- start:29 stop:535 length:507 start_codon:yes stop_codon:yes gene_type:complete